MIRARPLAAHVAVALAALLLAPAAASACGPYTVGLYRYAQLYFEDAQGRPAGIDKEVLEALAQRTGCELRPVVESRVRIWDQLQRGLLPITMSAVATPARRELAEFVPYTRGRYQLVMPRALAAQVGSLAEFEQRERLQLLVVKGFSHGPTLDAFIQRLRERGRLAEVADFPAAARMLMGGRADAMVTLPMAWRDAVGAQADSEDWGVLDAAPRDQVLGGMALSLTALPAADRHRLRQGLNALLANGTVQAILVRHLGERDGRLTLYGAD